MLDAITTFDTACVLDLPKQDLKEVSNLQELKSTLSDMVQLHSMLVYVFGTLEVLRVVKYSIIDWTSTCNFPKYATPYCHRATILINPQALLNGIMADRDVVHIFQVSDMEREIIDHNASCYVVGRSGTGFKLSSIGLM